MVQVSLKIGKISNLIPKYLEESPQRYESEEEEKRKRKKKLGERRNRGVEGGNQVKVTQ